MAKTTTDKLISELNKINGKKYPDVGYFMFSDVRGDGSNSKSVWQVIKNGGVSQAWELNDSNSRKRCAKIRYAIEVSKKLLHQN